MTVAYMAVKGTN